MLVGEPRKDGGEDEIGEGEGGGEEEDNGEAVVFVPEETLGLLVCGSSSGFPIGPTTLRRRIKP